jgi:hypothetical protein
VAWANGLESELAEDCYWNSNNTNSHQFYSTPTGLLRVLKCKQDSSPSKGKYFYFFLTFLSREDIPKPLDTIEAEKFIKFG